MKSTPAILIPVIILMGISCIKDKYDWNKFSDELEIHARIAAPLIKGSLSLDEIVNEISSENIGQFPDDSLVYIVYSDTFGSISSTSLISIPDQMFPESFTDSDISLNPEWTASGTGDTIEFIKQKNGVLNVSNNEKIDSLRIKTAILEIKVSSSFRHLGILHIHSNSIRKNRQPFMKEILISSSSGSFTSMVDVPLDDHVISFDNSNPSVTVLPFMIELYLINSGAPVQTGQRCNITISLESIRFSSIFGYLGEYDLFSGNGTFNIGIYDEMQGNWDLVFADPKFAIITSNSFGIPVEISLENVTAWSEKNHLTTPVTFSGVNPFDVNFQDINHIGQYAGDSLVICKDNSNILLAAGTEPNKFSYDISAKTDPSGPSGPYNFATDSSELNTVFEIILPLWLMGKDIILRDTGTFDIEKDLGDFYEYMDYLRITLAGTNGFPVKSSLQVYFSDSSGMVLDSLVSGSSFIIEPAETDPDGRVISTTEFKIVAEFKKDRLNRIRDTKKIIYRAAVNTADASSGQCVRFYAYNKIDFKLSSKAELSLIPGE
jgi:hypothetical protein